MVEPISVDVSFVNDLPTPLPLEGGKHVQFDQTFAVEAVSVQQRSTEPNPPLRYERRLSDAEVSYFLPSRQDGVNDMYVPHSVQIDTCFANLTAKLGPFTWASEHPQNLCDDHAFV